AYQVSGEYSMIKNAAKNNLINEEQAMTESLIAIKRAGADFIISYFAKGMAELLNSQNFI
ncbi:TPA: porphobilinogen synthase, partial [Legionella pneumophila]|nr:porphobilinogen synthase [Legionella pneumophila]